MRWKHLEKSDIIDIVAPASHCSLEQLQGGLDWLNSIGMIPRVPHHLIKPDAFFASELRTQFEHLKSALYSEAKAIWCLRGGYGSMRLIPELKKLKPPKFPKLLMGFSDITSLHLFLNQEWNWPSLHCKNLSQLSPGLKTPDVKELKKILRGEILEKTFKGLIPLNEAAKKTSTLEGKMIGGNLRILQSSLKTDWELRPQGKILFIEDVSERGYSVDRMLEQMIQAKLIHRGVKAIVFGDFSGGDEKDGTNLTSLALERFAQRVSYPVLKGLPCGHDSDRNFSLPFNTSCNIEMGPRSAKLTCSFEK